MSKIVSITWKGDGKVIPGYGTVSEGDTKSIPIDMAKSYVDQGLAEFNDRAKRSTKDKEATQ